MRKTLMVFLLFFLARSNSFSQNISGHVYERSSDGKLIPLSGAYVKWRNSQVGTVSDSTGYFSLHRDTIVTSLVISYIGFQTDTVNVLPAQEILDIVLSEMKILEQVEIVSSQATMFMQSTNPMLTQIMGEGELKKAACCNLSESFETNPSIDVNYADAVSGIKQLQMLGLSGIYAPVTVELIPLTRGLSSHSGLTFIPGPWVESIQVTKGIGSVSNGYESVSGQINVELKKPGKADKLFFNAYQNGMGRSEANLLLSTPKGVKWGSVLMLHGNSLSMKSDFNNDHFLDLPLGKQFNIHNRWRYENKKGFIAQFGAQAMNDERRGGTFKEMQKDNITDSSLYTFVNNVSRYGAYAKIGYVLPGQLYKSVGFISNAYAQSQRSSFGFANYAGDQMSVSAQLIYESVLHNTNHKYKTGISYSYDNYNETFRTLNFYRTEQVAGIFCEYTYNSKKLNMIAGARYDYHSLFGSIFTPRIHLKYGVTNRTTMRASFGKGQRTASIFSENSGVFVSSRQLSVIPSSNKGTAYGLKPEIAWNAGLSFTRNFKLNYREGTFVIDVFRTEFVNQVIVDLDKDPQQIVFYNLQGRSYSNSAQAEINYQPLRRFDARIAYRFFDVRSTYHGELLQRPLVAPHKALLNLSYKTKSKWHFDYTMNFTGKKRIPSTLQNPSAYQRSSFSPSYVTMNAQVSKSFLKKQNFEAYIGCENVTDFRQKDLILSADRPLGKYFDASLVWGPVIGRMFYAGLRYNLP